MKNDWPINEKGEIEVGDLDLELLLRLVLEIYKINISK